MKMKVSNRLARLALRYVFGGIHSPSEREARDRDVRCQACGIDHSLPLGYREKLTI